MPTLARTGRLTVLDVAAFEMLCTVAGELQKLEQELAATKSTRERRLYAGMIAERRRFLRAMWSDFLLDGPIGCAPRPDLLPKQTARKCRGAA